ncbi:MAG: peptide deformylase [Acidobacteria bacterium]|nr:peptide deformylase [Acidobacteriota bacterium]
MPEQKILLLGDDRLYQACRVIGDGEKDLARRVMGDLHDTLLAFRRRHGFGRAVAAPQIGELVRLVCLDVGEPEALVNPILSFPDPETYELWDDCMSFPGLEVRVRRYRRCVIDYLDLAWVQHRRELEGDLAELLQHECDHLDGVLAVQRAVHPGAFRFNPGKFGAPA